MEIKEGKTILKNYITRICKKRKSFKIQEKTAKNMSEPPCNRVLAIKSIIAKIKNISKRQK